MDAYDGLWGLIRTGGLDGDSKVSELTLADRLGDSAEHRSGGPVRPKFTRLFRPQMNGKVERFHRMMADGWPYARCCTSEWGH